MNSIPGGWSPEKAIDANVQWISNAMKNISEGKTGKTYKIFQPVVYRSQVVAGFNYLIKVYTDIDCVHLMVFQSPLLGDTISIKFVGAKGNYKMTDPLNPDEFKN